MGLMSVRIKPEKKLVNSIRAHSTFDKGIL